MDRQRVNGKYAGDREVFSGWKTIAQYLGKTVRTVQRYERDLRLPVRRPANKNRGASVIATKSEIDRWVRSASMRWRPEMAKAPLDVAECEVERLSKAVVQMRALCNEARRLKCEFSESRKTFSHQMQLIRTALASGKAQKSNGIQTRGVQLTCSYCKKIETNPQTRIELENYAPRHNHAEFNHGVCPDCLQSETDRMKVST